MIYESLKHEHGTKVRRNCEDVCVHETWMTEWLDEWMIDDIGHVHSNVWLYHNVFNKSWASYIAEYGDMGN